MDFGTVRNKLSNGLYTTLQQIEVSLVSLSVGLVLFTVQDMMYGEVLLFVPFFIYLFFVLVSYIS